MLDTQMPRNSQRDAEELCVTPEEELIKQQQSVIKELAELLKAAADCTENASASIFTRMEYAERMREIANKHLKGEQK